MKRITALLITLIFTITLTTTASAAVADVKPGNWAYDAVQFNINNKLIAIDYNTYDMNAPAPRQDVAYALYKLTNGKDTEPSPCTVVPEDMKNSPDKYKYSVQWAVDNDIINGTKVENGKLWFSPTDIITREQMATLLYRLAKHDGLGMGFNPFILEFFSDSMNISSWAQAAMCWCVSNGLVQGMGNNTLSPQNTLTYGQLAQVMMNYASFKNQETIVTPEPTPDPTPEEDLSGPWDYVQPITELPHGGYIENGHKYNKYGVCIDTVDGIPNNDEKRAFILINEYRATKGLKPLIWDQAAQVIAETRAIEGYGVHGKITINDGQNGAHKRPNGDEIDNILNEWNNIGFLKNHNYASWCYENAFGNCPEYWEVKYGDYVRSEGYGPKEIVDGWIASPGHEWALRTASENFPAQYAAVAYSHLDTDVDSYGNNTNYWYYNAITVY